MPAHLACSLGTLVPQLLARDATCCHHKETNPPRTTTGFLLCGPAPLQPRESKAKKMCSKRHLRGQAGWGTTGLFQAPPHPVIPKPQCQRPSSSPFIMRCLLPSSGCHPDVCEEEKLTPVEGAAGRQASGSPRGQAPPSHLSPREGTPTDSRTPVQNRQEKQQLLLGLREAPQLRGSPSTLSPGLLPRSVPAAGREQAQHPQREPRASTKTGPGSPDTPGRATVGYPLAPRGLLSGREQEVELLQGRAQGSAHVSSQPPRPRPSHPSQCALSLPAQARPGAVMVIGSLVF